MKWLIQAGEFTPPPLATPTTFISGVTHPCVSTRFHLQFILLICRHNTCVRFMRSTDSRYIHSGINHIKRKWHVCVCVYCNSSIEAVVIEIIPKTKSKRKITNENCVAANDETVLAMIETFDVVSSCVCGSFFYIVFHGNSPLPADNVYCTSTTCVRLPRSK